MKGILGWCSFIVSLLLLTVAEGQDIHFSHIHASPMFLNPAMTGLINHDFRFISNIKSQW